MLDSAKQFIGSITLFESEKPDMKPESNFAH